MKFIPCSFCLVSLFSISAAVSNGSFVSIKSHPYYVSTEKENHEPRIVSITNEGDFYNICGASILSDTWIVTAGHCIVDFSSEKKIRSGSSTDYTPGSIHDIEKVIVYGDYERLPKVPADNDIALIKLKNPLEFTELQHPVKIRSEPVKFGDAVVVVGLGTQGSGHTYTPALKIVTLKVTENYTCDDYHDLAKLGYRSNSFCAGGNGTDACQGDSGGPVVLDNELVGLVSYGPLCDHHAHPNESGGFTIIHQYRDWIYKHTGIWS